MNYKELKEWLKSADLADTEHSEHDECGNYSRTNIYMKDGKFFRLDFCNSEPSEKWESDKGFIRGVYEPEEVTRHTRMVEEVYYTRVDKQS